MSFDHFGDTKRYRVKERIKKGGDEELNKFSNVSGKSMFYTLTLTIYLLKVNNRNNITIPEETKNNDVVLVFIL